MNKKLFVTSVIILFVGVAFAPSIHADIAKKLLRPVTNSTEEKLVEITVSEYKPDGTIKKNIVEMPESQMKEMRGELRNVKDKEERLSIYKEYGLIPQDVTCEKLKRGMEEKAQRMGLTKEKIEKMTGTRKGLLSNNGLPFVLNFFCIVAVRTFLGLDLYFGLSFFTRWINFIIDWFSESDDFILSVDIASFHLTLLGALLTVDGFLPDNAKFFVPLAFILLIGFVGFVYITPVEEYLEGYAAIAFACGIPYSFP